jgi:hypothetical protein
MSVDRNKEQTAIEISEARFNESAVYHKSNAYNPLKPSGRYIYTTCFNTSKLCILPTQCICVFRMVLAINSDCFPKQH